MPTFQDEILFSLRYLRSVDASTLPEPVKRDVDRCVAELERVLAAQDGQSALRACDAADRLIAWLTVRAADAQAASPADAEAA